MLSPLFFAPIESLRIPNSKYEIVWYVEWQDYTLLYVRFTPADGLQPMDFEVLYKGEDLLAGDEHSGLIEELYRPLPAEVVNRGDDPRLRIPANIGNLGVSPGVVLALRDEANRVYFQ